MNNKFGQVGLISMALLSMIQLSVMGNETNVQIATQEATVSGSNNQVNQTINQTIINHPGVGSLNRNNERATTNNRRSYPQGNAKNRRNNRNDYDNKLDD